MTESNDAQDMKPPAVGGPEKQPKKRIPKARSGREIFKQGQSNTDRKVRLDAWEVQEGMYAGEDPEDQEYLEEVGKGHLSNFNTGGFKQIIDTDVAPFYSMVVNSRRPAVFSPIGAVNFQAGVFRDKWAERYRKILSAWPSHNFRVGQYLLERAKFGHGPIFWPKQTSWHFKPIPAWNLVVPQGSPADPDEWTLFFVVESVRPHDLIQVLSKMSDDKARAFKIDKWNKVELRKAIERFKEDGSDNLQHLDSIGEASIHQDAIRDEMLCESFWRSYSKWDRVTLVRMYVKEYSGKWSEQIFTANGEEGYLYEDVGVYRKASDIIQVNPYETAFDFHDVKGIGEHTCSLALSRERMVNKIIDISMLNSMLVLQGAGEADEALLEQIEWDPDVTLIPNELSIQSQNLRSDNQVLTAYEALTQIQDVVTRHRNAQSPQQETQSRTAKEYIGKILEKSELSEREKDLFTLSEKLKHANIMRRMLTMMPHMVEDGESGKVMKVFKLEDLDAADMLNPGFREVYHQISLAVTEDQLPLEMILSIDPESCVPEFDPTLKELQAIGDSVQRLGPAATDNFDRTWVRRVIGPSAAERMIGPDTGPNDNSDEKEAYGEHASFKAGYFVPVGTNDNHLVHAQIHLQHADRLFARYEKREGEYAEGAPLAPKTESFRELLALHEHNMGQDPGNLGHVRAIEATGAFPQETAELLQAWGQHFGLLQKLQAEIGEQSEAAEQQALEDAKGPDPVQMEKIRTEKMKQAMMVDAHRIQQGIKVEESQLDQLLKLSEHQTNQAARQ